MVCPRLIGQESCGEAGIFERRYHEIEAIPRGGRVIQFRTLTGNGPRLCAILDVDFWEP
jgi:hypothetical protein